MSKKILIVDDEESVRESLKLILGDHYELILTDSDAQCIDCLDMAQDIGLVLLDIKMPQASGLETLQKIREKRPDMKVVIVTGYKSVETAAEAAKLGAAGYITKPFKPEEILKTIEEKLR